MSKYVRKKTIYIAPISGKNQGDQCYQEVRDATRITCAVGCVVRSGFHRVREECSRSDG